MPETKDSLNKLSRGLFWLIILAAFIYLVIQKIAVLGNVLKVAIGFGAVVIIHEFGHFVIAKITGIKVEAFSIFMPPTLLGIRKTKEGLRFRFLPRFLGKESKESDTDTVTAPEKQQQEAETEYRIGLIPFGGYLKMLGQDDIGPVKTSDDPRSFANKPVSTRMGVITAGVVFNALSAVTVFMIVFLIGIKLPPAAVGDVIPNSPAARAGLKPNDEIIEIAGKSKDLDFSNIGIAAALSDVNEAVPLKVRHEDGSIEQYTIVAERIAGSQLKAFGILQPVSLTIAKLSKEDVIKLYARTGLQPGDQIKAINSRDVHSYWELVEIVTNTLAPQVTLLAERTDKTGRLKMVQGQAELELVLPEQGHIYSMVPRLEITDISEKRATIVGRIISWFYELAVKIGLKKEAIDTKPRLQKGDIILEVGDVSNPTYKEMRDITKKYQGKELAIKVLRIAPDGTEEILGFNVLPKRVPDSNEVLIGIGVALDTAHLVVAKTIDVNGLAKLDIPRGARIMAVDGVPVSNFYDVIREIRKYPGERITIDWRVNDEVAGDVALNVTAEENAIAVKSTFAEFIPFERLERLYKADGPIEAIGMGCRKTIMFIAQTYITLRRWIGGLLGPKSFIGPVGIIAVSYRIVTEQPLIYYMYFLGLISAVIAVINFLPLPPLDGGLIVLLLVEKIKGSALNVRTQEILAYTGWILICAFFLYITFNDIVRLISGG